MLRLSVILATYNRGASGVLRQTLTHLGNQSLGGDSYEIIVIDDASPDNTRELVLEMAKTMPCEVKYLTHSENRGPGFTQNQGIREARGQYLLLMADDIYMSKDALAQHLRSHEEHPGDDVAILGDVRPSPDAQTSVFMRNFDPFRFQELCAGLDQLPYYMFGACNISLSTKFMLEHGMFLEHRGRGGAAAHEDMEIGYRMNRKGLRIYFNKDAWAHHYHIYTLDSAIKRMYERGLNWDEFRQYMPDPEFLVLSHLLNKKTFAEYRRVLRGPNAFAGREKLLGWHLIREGVRRLAFSGLTVNRFWKPLFERAETSPRIARMVRPSLYRAFLFHYFTRGVLDAEVKFGQPVAVGGTASGASSR